MVVKQDTSYQRRYLFFLSLASDLSCKKILANVLMISFVRDCLTPREVSQMLELQLVYSSNDHYIIWTPLNGQCVIQILHKT